MEGFSWCYGVESSVEWFTKGKVADEQDPIRFSLALGVTYWDVGVYLSN
jgi:hypothetical protein